MRSRLAWVAISLLVFVSLPACGPRTRDTNQASTQAANTSRPVAKSTGIITAAHTAKDDGKGGLGEKTDAFGPADRTIHCVVELAEARSGTRIRYSWWIVDAEGLKTRRSTTSNIRRGRKTEPFMDM